MTMETLQMLMESKSVPTPSRAPAKVVHRTRWEKHYDEALDCAKRNVSFHPCHVCPKYMKTLEEFGFSKPSQSFRFESGGNMVSYDNNAFDPKIFTAADIKSGTDEYCKMLIKVGHEHAEDRPEFFDLAWEKEGYSQDQLAHYIVEFMRKRIKRSNWAGLAETDAESLQQFLVTPAFEKKMAGKTQRAPSFGGDADAGGGGGRGNKPTKKPKIAPGGKNLNFCSAYLVPRIECEYHPNCKMEHPKCFSCGGNHSASACTSYDVSKHRDADAKRRTANNVVIRGSPFWNDPTTVRTRKGK
jgi:hypothetical protein